MSNSHRDIFDRLVTGWHAPEVIVQDVCEAIVAGMLTRQEVDAWFAELCFKMVKEQGLWSLQDLPGKEVEP